MRLAKLLPIAIALIAAPGAILAQAAPLPQPTARDTAFEKKFEAEANRKNGPRKSVINALADSLIRPTAAPPPLPAAPVATFTVACDTSGTFLCQFDATKSTGYKLGYLWDCGAVPNCTPGNTAAFGFRYPHEGERTVKLTARDSLGRQAQAQRTFTVAAGGSQPPPDTTTPPDTIPPPVDTSGVVLPELPRSSVDAGPKPCVRQIDVNPPQDLQTAINSAIPGDCLNLPQGSEFKGNFTLPDRCVTGTGWVTIQTKGIADKPGVRITRGELAALAKITQVSNQASIWAGHPSCRWNLLHLNIQADPSYTGLIYHLVGLGDGGWTAAGEKNTAPDKQPADFILRRSWIHGHASTNLVRCVVLNGVRQAVVDNIIEDCHAAGFDSQAIEGWNGFGPFLIENNFLAGAGENVMFGGADPAIKGLRPCDITLRRNHIWKDPAWVGGRWSIKNLWELKNACRVLFEGNVLENVWVASQVGMAIVLKSSTDTCGPACGWQGTSDVTIRYNRIHDAHRGLNLQAIDGQTDIHVQRVVAEHNLFYNIGNPVGTQGSDGWLLLLTHDLKDVLIRFNTFVGNRPDAGLALYLAYASPTAPMRNLRILNNVLAGQNYYHIGADGAPGCCQKALEFVAPGSWTFAGNVVSEVEPDFLNPSGNTYFASIAQIGLTADFRAPNHPGKGADITTLELRTAGVVQTVTPKPSGGPRGAPRPPLTATARDVEYMARQPKSLP